ncbi:unnamed protein product [Rangifer tarandus platyrhynchus]|uniref:Uncharacterized protein n=1 Tax=Rangifer tarandus platyrhynchus TaxID=3082113 RepID=A0ABN8XLW5_RANTA|nr:unnamed protein product [Rangifer tarandus platyrhynchus]
MRAVGGQRRSAGWSARVRVCSLAVVGAGMSIEDSCPQAVSLCPCEARAQVPTCTLLEKNTLAGVVDARGHDTAHPQPPAEAVATRRADRMCPWSHRTVTGCKNRILGDSRSCFVVIVIYIKKAVVHGEPGLDAATREIQSKAVAPYVIAQRPCRKCAPAYPALHVKQSPRDVASVQICRCLVVLRCTRIIFSDHAAILLPPDPSVIDFEAGTPVSLTAVCHHVSSTYNQAFALFKARKPATAQRRGRFHNSASILNDVDA